MNSVLKKTKIASCLLVLSNIGYAQECKFDVNNVLTGVCSDYKGLSVTDNGDYYIKDSILTTGKAIYINAALAFEAASPGDLNVTVDDLTLNHMSNASGILVKGNEDGSNVFLVLNGDNTIILSDQKRADTALLTEAEGNSTIIINGKLTLENHGTGDNLHDGIEANAKHGNVTIHFNGTGTVGTVEGNAIFGNVERKGDVDIIVAKGVTLTTEANRSTADIIREGQDLFPEEAAEIAVSIGINSAHQSSHGISANVGDAARGNKIAVNNQANIDINGRRGSGIYARNQGESSTIDVVNLGIINVIGQDNIDGHGIYTQSKDGVTTITNSGQITTVSGTSNAIHAVSQGKINVINDAELTSQQYGIYVKNGTGTTIVSLNDQSVINGGIAGIHIAEGKAEITNRGIIGAKNDLAIESKSTQASHITNSGTITGRILTNAKMDFTNTTDGVFELRHVENDTKNIAVSNFSGGNINNQGSIKFGVVSASISNPTGELSVPGVDNISTAENGIVQAHLTGVNEFRHSGTIDLRGSGLAGNILKISGQDANHLSTFVSDGGEIHFKTVLNAGDVESRSDLLILDNIKLGSKATNIIVDKIEESEVETKAHGIRLVQTLGVQDERAFVLGSPVTYGIYEYRLSAVNTNSNGEQGFYLVNYDEPLPDEEELLTNPVVGGYLGMQYAAGIMFNQNILDRRDNVRKPDETVWGRIQYNEAKTKHMDNTQSLKIENTLIQLGWDLYQDQNEKGAKVFGIYAGYGHSDVKNRSLQTGTKVGGTVDGYQLGAYYSWFKQDDIGPYIDMWGHLAKYRNKLKGATYEGQHTVSSTSYNGHGFSVSIEAGHGFIVGQSDDNKTNWVLEPHAQVTYNYIKLKNMVDGTGTRFSNNKAKGLDTRLGARFYGYRDNNDALRPYVELNWLHNGMDNAIYVNNIKQSSRIGRNIIELKIGTQGHFSKDLSMFAHIGYQKGKDNFKNTELQVGLNYNF